MELLSNSHGHGTSSNVIVHQLGGHRYLLGQRYIGDASDKLGHFTLSVLEFGKEGFGTGCESAGGRRGVGAAFSLDAKFGADRERLAARAFAACRAGAVHHDELGKGVNLEVGALGARLDKGSGEGEDGAGAEGRVKGLGHGNLLGEDADGGLVTGLDGEDGAGGAEDGLVREQRRGAEVCREANVFEDGGRLHHAGGVGEAKLVLAGLDGLHAALGEGGLQQADVLGLGLANLLEVVDFLLVEAEGGKIGGGKLGEALLVKGVFEIFEREGAGGEES